MPSYLALAFDLDGTLLGRDDRISKRNLDAIRRASVAGMQVIVASARWFAFASEAAAQLTEAGVPVTGPAVACSGAQVRRISDGADLFDRRVPLEFAQALAALCDDRRCVAWAALAEDVVVKMDGPLRADLPGGMRRVASLVESVAADAPRMLLIQGSDVCAQIEADMAPLWNDRVRFVESFSGTGKRILTLTAQGADKGTALRVACLDLGIEPSSVVAFGDAENDIEMFRVAGASVAMGQAGDHVKSEATYISASGHDDGVAQGIERLLDRGEL